MEDFIIIDHVLGLDIPVLTDMVSFMDTIVRIGYYKYGLSDLIRQDLQNYLILRHTWDI